MSPIVSFHFHTIAAFRNALVAAALKSDTAAVRKYADQLDAATADCVEQRRLMRVRYEAAAKASGSTQDADEVEKLSAESAEAWAAYLELGSVLGREEVACQS